MSCMAMVCTAVIYYSLRVLLLLLLLLLAFQSSHWLHACMSRSADEVQSYRI